MAPPHFGLGAPRIVVVEQARDEVGLPGVGQPVKRIVVRRPVRARKAAV